MGSQYPVPRLDYSKCLEKVAEKGPMLAILIHIRSEE